MRLTSDFIDYLWRVDQALEDGDRIDSKYLTDVCPECGVMIDWLDGDDSHLVVPVKEYPTPAFREQASDWRVYVVIGCEGYWVIDPSQLGMPRGSWQDWTLAQ